MPTAKKRTPAQAKAVEYLYTIWEVSPDPMEEEGRDKLRRLLTRYDVVIHRTVPNSFPNITFVKPGK